MSARAAAVIVFDVNETLLDLRGLDEPFAEVFGEPALRVDWFRQVLHSALVSIAIDRYFDFGTLGRAALDTIARRRGRELSTVDRQRVLGAMTRLPPHPEVRGALEVLSAAGVRLAALTNSTESMAGAQLAHAGLTPFFEAILSADSVRRLKPAPEPYWMAAKQLRVAVPAIRLVSAHAWDVAGALHAACTAAFVARPGMTLDPLLPPPDIVGRDLREVADRILEVELR